MDNSVNIDRSVDIEIGGQPRQLKFTIDSILELEKLTGKSAFTLATSAPRDLTMKELIDLIMCGLAGKNPGRQTVGAWVLDYLRSGEPYALHVLLISALGFSGLIGDVSVFEEMVARLNNTRPKEEEAAGEQ